MEQVKEFDALNVSELIANGKELLNGYDYYRLSHLLLTLERQYQDRNKIISSSLLAHISRQICLGGYTNIHDSDIKIYFQRQSNKFIQLAIYMKRVNQSDYLISTITDIECCYFKGTLNSPLFNSKYYTYKELLDKRF